MTKIYARLEENTFRYLIGDKRGQLHMIDVTQKNGSEFSILYMIYVIASSMVVTISVSYIQRKIDII